jgi:hypothetical protein
VHKWHQSLGSIKPHPWVGGWIIHQVKQKLLWVGARLNDNWRDYLLLASSTRACAARIWSRASAPTLDPCHLMIAFEFDLLSS